MAALPPGIRLFVSLSRDQWFRALVLVLTFLFYCSFHLSRKPITIVKGELHRHCSEPHEVELHSYKEFVIHNQGPLYSEQNASRCGWAPFDKKNYKQLLGALDYSFLCAYAIGMFLSGMIGERLPLRYFLSCGMLASGLFTALFGFGYFYNIHNLSYYIIIQVLNGLVQTTGWPSVVTCIGNWFGKGKRGLIMGVWNSHTSVGNILGSLIAGYWVSNCWGMSFLVPGMIISFMGIICFLFLVEHPQDIKSEATPAPQGCHVYKVQNKLLQMTEAPEQQEFQDMLGPSPIYPTHHVIVLQKEIKIAGNGSAAISFLGALKIPGVVEFSMCLLFAKLVSYTFLFWLPLYIKNVGHMDVRRAGDLSTLFDVGGIIGGIVAGVISDKAQKRATTCGFMLLCSAPTLYFFSSVSNMGAGFTVGMLLVCGALVNGPYSLITTAVSADLGTHKSLKGNAHALSTVTAIIDGTGSVGAALGPLLAGLLSPYGWDNVFFMLMLSDALALLFLLRLIRKELSCRRPNVQEITEYKEH
ncbi:solute carrier family 37 (glucose-6-phosphate transporter), member 1 L homeolog [Xenopus laevis]|uniref:Glucose-6-phosphate exchanger SLC37A2 n=1 Tax=Xenopus laevis TaxID=8355 RepID=Q7ZTQ0_XENLA|nr:solute carrier family 37 (glucose-6-phosphate transporter), member 1 L homeolog [Xenopus laevis]AAH43786.1 Slc37a1-prov protein [Xenopus laevis]